MIFGDLAPAPAAPSLGLKDAYARYEEIRSRLPAARAGGEGRSLPSLQHLAGGFDGFLFDSFGVLNVGENAIAGAAACLERLRREGKRFCVLTNAASYTADAALAKYRRMGLDLGRDEIISSRDVALARLDDVGPGFIWAGICADGDRFGDSGARIADLLGYERLWDEADGFVFLSGARWNGSLQDRLVAALAGRPRPVVVANPDLVAPREDGLSVEPGYWAHDLEDRTGLRPVYHGKPHPTAFDAALARLGPGRYAMVGDTLHTDILGGQAAGLATVLVTRHGLFAGHDVAPFIEASGISPDFVIPAI